MQYTVLGNVPRQLELRDAIQKLLKWSWRRNKNLEEQAAQLHMLVGWTQLVEVLELPSLLDSSAFDSIFVTVRFRC